MKSGMYGEMPIIKIGKYEISDMSEDGDSVWIWDTETHEGAEFKKETLLPIIDKFFNENF